MEQMYPNRSGAWLLLLACCAIAPAHAARGPAQPKDPGARRCSLPSDELSGQVQLDGACFYEQPFLIKTSGTTLNCRGAELRASSGYVLTIRGDIENVTVRNCYVRGGNGIAVRPPNRNAGESDDALRARAPRNLILERLHVSRSDNVGVYLHQFTEAVTLRNSVVEDNSSAGIYLAPYGRAHVIRDNRIANNGHTKPDGTPRLAWARREGIAIDASQAHLIEENTFEDNALGGVLLYKNCWEHAATNPNSRPRTEHASDSVIRGNHFRREVFGVWIASRQSRDLDYMECGDPTPYDNPLWWGSIVDASYDEDLHPSAYTSGYFLPWLSAWPDFAENNTVEGNLFEDIQRGGIRVEDDGATLRGNLFVGEFDYIFVGAPFRTRLDNHPVRDTLIRDNSYHSPASPSFAARLYLVPGEHSGTVLENNLRACVDAEGRLTRHGAPLDAALASGSCNPTPHCEDGAWIARPAEGCPTEVAAADAGDAMIDAGPLAGDAAGADAGSGGDALPDAGAVDHADQQGVPDAGYTDAGHTDAGHTDAGSPPPPRADAGAIDALGDAASGAQGDPERNGTGARTAPPAAGCHALPAAGAAGFGPMAALLLAARWIRSQRRRVAASAVHAHRSAP